jgi:hypothetical protein
LGEAVTAATFIVLDEEFNWLEYATLCAINAIAAPALLFS